MTEPHDAGLKRFEAREAKREARTEILEKIAEAAFDVEQAWSGSLVDGVWRIYRKEPDWCGFWKCLKRIQDLEKELEDVPKESS